MNRNQLKQAAARAAFDYLEARLGDDTVIGIGTGSTVNYLIDEMAKVAHRTGAVVASSEATAQRLRQRNIAMEELNNSGMLDLYIDGADEANHHLQLIKGGGAALTREKIMAAAAREFVCIADASKLVDRLGKFPLPVEVIPMARSHVARQIIKLGGKPVYRQDCVTDNGNHLLDVHNLEILQPAKLESDLNQIAGVVTNGLFAPNAGLICCCWEPPVESRPSGLNTDPTSSMLTRKGASEPVIRNQHPCSLCHP